MAELLSNVPIGEQGMPAPYFLTRWRTVGRALPTYRPLPAAVAIYDNSGNPTGPYQSLFKQVFGIGIDPQEAIADPATGLPTKTHRDIWRMIP